MKIIWAWCLGEGKSALVREKEPLDDNEDARSVAAGPLSGGSYTWLRPPPLGRHSAQPPLPPSITAPQDRPPGQGRLDIAMWKLLTILNAILRDHRSRLPA